MRCETEAEKASLIRKLSEYEIISGFLWLSLAIGQMCTCCLAIAGIWNIFVAASRFLMIPRIKARDAKVPEAYEGLGMLIAIGVVNLFLGGLIGILWLAFDYIFIRNQILENRHVFNKTSPAETPQVPSHAATKTNMKSTTAGVCAKESDGQQKNQSAMDGNKEAGSVGNGNSATVADAAHTNAAEAQPKQAKAKIVETREHAQAATPTQEQPNGTAKPKLWNPGAAVWWSLLFSPIFGTAVHAINWRALGKPEQARSMIIWTVAIAIGMPVLYALAPSTSAGMTPCVIAFLAWYFATGRKQEKYVRETLGDNYERKKWSTPISIALACMGIVMLLIVVCARIVELQG